MLRNKKVFIIILAFMLVFTFCGSVFAGEYSDGTFERFENGHTQYKEVDGQKVPVFEMPWEVQKWCKQLPEWEQIDKGELGLLVIHSVEPNKCHSWFFWVLPQDAKVFLQPYNGTTYMKLSCKRGETIYRAGIVNASSGTNYLELDNWQDAPKKVGTGWELLDTTHTYKMVNGQRCFYGYSSVPVYNDEAMTNLFFLGSHLENEEVKLIHPMQVAEIPEMIKKLVTILTKVGLTMFCLFLLVSLVRYKMFL